MKRWFFLVLALVLTLLPLTAAAAEEAAAEDAAADGESEDPYAPSAEFAEAIESYCASNYLDASKVGVAVRRTDTGETYYYNGNEWFFSCSLYKVPLMMMLAEKEYSGEYTADSVVAGQSLHRLESYILTYSNNDLAHAVMSLYGSDDACVELFKQFAPNFAGEDYPDDFRYSRYFSPRLMTEFLDTLYFNSECYPNVIECMKLAQTDDYFYRTLGEYDIAQKYGSYESFQHCAGIIYTPVPLIVTVMTDGAMDPCVQLADLGKIAVDYALEQIAADEAEAAYWASDEGKAELAHLEAEQKAAEEAAEAERLAAEKQEAERLAAEEAARSEELGARRTVFAVLFAVLVLTAFAAAVVQVHRR